MSRTGIVKFGILFELMDVPDIGIMQQAYGKCEGHTCGECQHHTWTMMFGRVHWPTCAKLRNKSEIRCEDSNPACGKFEAETTKGEVKDSE